MHFWTKWQLTASIRNEEFGIWIYLNSNPLLMGDKQVEGFFRKISHFIYTFYRRDHIRFDKIVINNLKDENKNLLRCKAVIKITLYFYLYIIIYSWSFGFLIHIFLISRLYSFQYFLHLNLVCIEYSHIQYLIQDTLTQP